MAGYKEHDRWSRPDNWDHDEKVRDRSPVFESEQQGKRIEYFVYVANLPLKWKWFEIKDFFTRKLGEAVYVKEFKHNSRKFRGAYTISAPTRDKAEDIYQTLSDLDLKAESNKLMVFRHEDLDRYIEVLPEADVESGPPKQGPPHKKQKMTPKNGPPVSQNENPEQAFETYGLNVQWLHSLGIKPPLNNTIYVCNLPFETTKDQVRNIFKMAGTILEMEMLKKGGTFRGIAVITYDHPVEAVQAVSLFHGQKYHGRDMMVSLNRGHYKVDNKNKLPDGLQSIGKGLGPNGKPLRNVPLHVEMNKLKKEVQNSDEDAQNRGTRVWKQDNYVPEQDFEPPDNHQMYPQNQSHSGLMGMQANMPSAPMSNIQASSMPIVNQPDIQNVVAQAIAKMITPALAQNQEMNLMNQFTGVNSLTQAMNQNTQNAINAQVMQALQSQMGTMPAMAMGGFSQVPQDMTTNLQQDLNMQPPNKSTVVAIRYLPPKVTCPILQNKFGEAGPVIYAEMLGPGTAKVHFMEPWAAERAVKMFHGSRIDGQAIEVKLC